MPREIDRKYGSGVTRISQDVSTRNETKPLKKRKKINKRPLPKSAKTRPAVSENPGAMGNPAVVKTYESAKENAMINRDVPAMKNGGEAKTRGMGCAIKGGKFQGVF